MIRRDYKRPPSLAIFIALAVFIFLLYIGLASAAVFYGTDGPDRIIGTNNDDTISTYAGADYVGARGGFDEVYAGGGKDEVYGSTEADQLYGQGGADRLYAGCPDSSCDAGHDNILWGGSGDDTLAADNGRADILDGGTGWDICYIDGLDIWSRCEVVL